MIFHAFMCRVMEVILDFVMKVCILEF